MDLPNCAASGRPPAYGLTHIKAISDGRGTGLIVIALARSVRL
jgi:hypothetical protein